MGRSLLLLLSSRAFRDGRTFGPEFTVVSARRRGVRLLKIKGHFLESIACHRQYLPVGLSICLVHQRQS